MSVEFGFDGLVPTMYFDGASYLIPPDAHGVVTGTESWMASAQRGLTLGCWAKPTALTSGRYLISRYKSSSERGYALYVASSGQMQLFISSDGTTSNYDAILSSEAFVAGEWSFFVGRWNATNISIWTNGVKTTAASGESSIFDPGVPMEFGSLYLGTSGQYIGYMAYPFICAASLSDAIIENIYNKTKTLFE